MSTNLTQTIEAQRLQDAREKHTPWKKWGPYLSERAWGTVREDYSANGDAWRYFPHEYARSKAYRWGEDGIAGISDRHQILCFSVALWNGQDPFLKERLFGLTGPQGNHGEDVKEYYFYLDATPTHSYLKYLYKYPQARFPYEQLIAENQRRTRQEPEFDLLDTGVFDGDRYFDVLVEYAKAAPEDILIRLSVTNRGAETAELDLLPTLWYRNTWSWGADDRRPRLRLDQDNPSVIRARHFEDGLRQLICDDATVKPTMLFTENETNVARLYGVDDAPAFVKDGINDFIVHGDKDAINPNHSGTKASARYHLTIAAGATAIIKLRLTNDIAPKPALGFQFDETFATRIREADEFYDAVTPLVKQAGLRTIQRQAFAGMIWSKQFYYYHVRRWLRGDPGTPPPPRARRRGRNHEWTHLDNAEIISMPDKWEYPWFAAWDLAFHCLPFALIDPDFAQAQLILMLREWYMHPNGQIPAYEWNFGDVNPPVHAWAALRVYQIEQEVWGRKDRAFLERVFHKLLLNFTWWVNRKDAEGNNVFQGGFLGLDNIGVFDRSSVLPNGGSLEQSDATSWMGMYCLNLMNMALELAKENPAYEDVASKFFEHFVHIARAMNDMAGQGIALWDEEDGFYYDVLHLPNQRPQPLRVRSMVGLIPLFATTTLEEDTVRQFPGFRRRMQYFIDNYPELSMHIETQATDRGLRRFLSLVSRDRLRRVLKFMLAEDEFLSPYGIRSLSRFHLAHPYTLQLDANAYQVSYEPAESQTPLFGGNSNWRGPVWFPVNYLLLEALQNFYAFLGDDFKIEYPTGSGQRTTLAAIHADLSARLTQLFVSDQHGQRPIYGTGTQRRFQTDAQWRDLVLFYEYFNGDTGEGLGASHQTGWTGLVAKLIHEASQRA
ncbi:MAG TPA: glucosidase [Blastocatellia bacterium]|nr:glucosidase [Blastocatellia bacterium]